MATRAIGRFVRPRIARRLAEKQEPRDATGFAGLE